MNLRCGFALMPVSMLPGHHLCRGWDCFGLGIRNGNPIYRHLQLQSIKPNQDLLQKAVIKLRERLNGFEAEVLLGLDCYSLRHAATQNLSGTDSPAGFCSRQSCGRCGRRSSGCSQDRGAEKGEACGWH